jgi:hypothetical protein
VGVQNDGIPACGLGKNHLKVPRGIHPKGNAGAQKKSFQHASASLFLSRGSGCGHEMAQEIQKRLFIPKGHGAHSLHKKILKGWRTSYAYLSCFAKKGM